MPFGLRLLLAARADAFSAMTRLFVEQVFRWQRDRAREMGLSEVESGAVVAQHRGGASVNVNPHLHAVLPDGLFTLPDPQSRAVFHRLPAPTSQDLIDIAHNTHQRFVAWLGRKGLLTREDDDQICDHTDERSALEACTEGSLGVGTLVTLRKAGSGSESQQSYDGGGRRYCTGEWAGYSLYVGDAIGAGDRGGRERLVRYCLRPALSPERLSIRRDGRIVYEVKATRRGKATQRVMTAMEFMGRLAALVPPPRHPMTRYFGAFGPHSAWRRAVVPDVCDEEAECHARGLHEGEGRGRATGVDGRSVGGADAALEASSPNRQTATAAAQAAVLNEHNETTANAEQVPARLGPRYRMPQRLDWASLMKRVWSIDPLECECGGRMRFVGLVKDPDDAARSLERLGMLPEIPPLARARSPTFENEPVPDWD